MYWTRNAPIELPPDLVARFKGKVMAITGYEVDQVTHTAPLPPWASGTSDNLGGFSCYPDCGCPFAPPALRPHTTSSSQHADAPAQTASRLEGYGMAARRTSRCRSITHTTTTTSAGLSAPMQRSPLPHLHREWAHTAHICTETAAPVAPRVDQVYDVAESETAAKRVHLPNPTRTRVRARAGANTSYPTNIVFKENPGGEYRKSYHGYPATSCPGPGHICRRTSWPAKENALFIRYPSGYAQLIASPNQWLVEPMQIDTHNRNYSLTDTPG